MRAAKSKILLAILQGTCSSIDDVKQIVSETLRSPEIFPTLIATSYPGRQVDPIIIAHSLHWEICESRQREARSEPLN
jgi:hypothetical protein